MLALTLLVVSIALADSVNPSTLVPALWLAGAPGARGLGSYTCGVFVVYLAGGLVLLLGPGPALIGALRHVGGPIEHVLQAVGGVVALAFALAMWRSRGARPDRPPQRRLRGRASALVLGAGIMAVELPTAFMYFGAITAILAAHRDVASGAALVVVYNALFVAPLLGILAARRLAGERGQQWLDRGEAWLRRGGRLALTAVAGAGGSALLVLGLVGLLAA